MHKQKNSSSKSTPGSPIKNDPFYEIEMDIRTLMKRCGTLEHELNENKKDWELKTKKMLLDFIEVADTFENRFREIGAKGNLIDQETKTWVNKFRIVHKLLLRALKAVNVTPIQPIIGEKANPYWHNVVEVVKDPIVENETIIEEIKKGYLWEGKPLRAADIKAVRNL